MKLRVNKILFYVHFRIHIIIFLVSLISLIFVFLKLIDFNIIIGIENVKGLNSFYQLLVIPSSIFVILFLPSYPIFFLLLKKSDFTFLEKLSLTIVINSVFYISLGYIGYCLGIELSKYYFFFSLTIFFLILIGVIILIDLKKEDQIIFKSKRLFHDITGKLKQFSLIRYIKNTLNLNGIFLFIFIFFICILNIVKYSIFVGTDPWLHIFNSQIITKENFLYLKGYHGTLGISIFGAVINFFSGLGHVLIPKYFVFYTYFLSAILFYNISLRIFRNKNLAIFSVFILEFSSLGFSNMMLQYWPSGSALIKCLAVFLLLYKRLEGFLKVERPSKEDIFRNIALYYSLITIIFVSAVLTHVITSLIFLFSFLWLYLIYFLRDYKRGIDFIFLCSLTGLFLLLNVFGIGSGHYWFFTSLNFSWYILLLIGIAGCCAGFIFLWRIQKTIIFTKGRYKSAISGDKNRFLKKIEDRVIIPLIFSFLMILTLCLLIVNLVWMEIGITNIFYVLEIVMLSSFAIWGLILFQKKPRGKPLFIWAIGLFLLLGGGFLFNILILNNMIWQRILYLIPPITVIGFSSYIYKIIKLNKIRTFQMKFVILFIITFSLFSSFFYQSVSFNVFTLKRRNVSSIQWYTSNVNYKNVLITEFGWNHVFRYYGYIYNNSNSTLLYEGNFIKLKYETDLFPPSNHFFDNGTNILQQIKKNYGTDVYLIFEDTYIINKGFDLFGQLSKEEEEEYYNLDYLNKVCSSKTKKGAESPIFWVI